MCVIVLEQILLILVTNTTNQGFGTRRKKGTQKYLLLVIEME